MSSFFDSGPLPDWKDIQKWLGKDMPWEQVKNWGQENDSDWLGQYVKEMMRKPLGKAKVHTQEMLKMEAVKDTKYVNVTINFAPGTELGTLQLFAAPDYLRVSGLSNQKKRILRFPCLVYPRTGKAVMKKDQISIRFRRRRSEKLEYELFIHT